MGKVPFYPNIPIYYKTYQYSAAIFIPSENIWKPYGFVIFSEGKKIAVGYRKAL